MGKRELVALPSLSSLCLVIVVWLFLAVPWVCLHFVTVIFPEHTVTIFKTLPHDPGVQNESYETRLNRLGQKHDCFREREGTYRVGLHIAY